MSPEAEEILRTMAAAEHDMHARLREINAMLERALVLLHAIERDRQQEPPPTSKSR